MATLFVVRPNGAIEEMAPADVADMIGPEIVTPTGQRCLRWQVKAADGQWLVIDASNGVVFEELADEAAARLMAARWNVEEGLQEHDLLALNVFDVVEDREAAERLAARARAINAGDDEDAPSLRELRLRIGWSQRQAARRWGVSHPTVAAWERGRRPAPPEYRHWLEAIAEAVERLPKTPPASDAECPHAGGGFSSSAP